MELDRDRNGGALTARDLWEIADHQPVQLVLVGGRKLNRKFIRAYEAVDAYPIYKVVCSDYANAPVFVSHPTDICDACKKNDNCNRENYWNMGVYLALEG